MLCHHSPAYRGLFVHHVIIGGFRQSRDRLAGVDRVFAALAKFASPEVRVTPPMRWNEDWAAEAEFIARHRQPGGEPPVVCLYAYSWGVGYGAVQLATRLEALDIPVECLVSCDGVYRHAYRAGNWRAFWPWSTIRLPENVRKVHAFCQRQGWLRGHRLRCGGQVIEPTPIDRVQINGFADRASHYNLDESPQWLTRCEQVARLVQLLLQERLRQ